jgi:hypothetical protein
VALWEPVCIALFGPLFLLSGFPDFEAAVRVGFWLLARSSALGMEFGRGLSAVVLMLAPEILSVFDG